MAPTGINNRVLIVLGSISTAESPVIKPLV